MWVKKIGLSQYQPISELNLGFQAAQKQEPFQVQVDGFQMRRQVLCHQEFHTVLLDTTVVGKVLPANVGTDRYLSERTGSTGNTHQVNRGPPALLLDMGQGIIGHGYYHSPTSDIYLWIRNYFRKRFDNLTTNGGGSYRPLVLSLSKDGSSWIHLII